MESVPDREEQAALRAALALQWEWGAEDALEPLPQDRTRAPARPAPPDPSTLARPAADSPPRAAADPARGAVSAAMRPGAMPSGATPSGAPAAARRPAPAVRAATPALHPAAAALLAGGPPPTPAMTRAAELAAAAETLPALKAAMEAYESGLRDTATQIVFADGVAESGLMMIGEAPGADEDRVGFPFRGVSGRLLDRMVASIGLSRERDFYLTNIVCWRPPGNRTPTDMEVSLFLPFTRRHIALARPRRLVLLGGTAAKALLGAKEGITRLRGRWRTLEVEGLGPVPTLPTLHPAYLLRQSVAKREAWTDLILLRRALDEDRAKGKPAKGEPARE